MRVNLAFNCRLRRQDTDAVVFRLPNSRARARMDGADDGNRKRFSRGFKCNRRTGVARENHDLRTAIDEKVCNGKRKKSDFFGRASTVRNVCGVRKVQQFRVRQSVLNAARNGQATDARIADADDEWAPGRQSSTRIRIAHGLARPSASSLGLEAFKEVLVLAPPLMLTALLASEVLSELEL